MQKKAIFSCQKCGKDFEKSIPEAIRTANSCNFYCQECNAKEIANAHSKTSAKKNSLAKCYPELAATLSQNNSFSADEVSIGCKKVAIFICPECGEEYSRTILNAVSAAKNNIICCRKCSMKQRGKKRQLAAARKNSLAAVCPEAAKMLSPKNLFTAEEVSAGTAKRAIFTCPECGHEYLASIKGVTSSIKANGYTYCHDCNMKKKMAVSKPEWFYTRFMLAFAGKNGIANPFFDVRCILGKNSFMGLDFTDNVQKVCYEYNGFAWHSDDETITKDRFKFEAARKAGYTMIRVLEPGLDILDSKYDIVMPDSFFQRRKYNAEIMEEIGRKIIHLLEGIYGYKASPEILALNNFKEFEVWYDANKKELETNALENMMSHKTAAKKAA